MRWLCFLILLCCGRRVWQAPDPTSRAAALSARVDAAAPERGVFSVRTPRGVWVYEVNASRDEVFSVGEVKMAYASTLLLQLIDQRKAQLDDPAHDYSLKVPDATLRETMRSTEGIGAVQELARVLGATPFNELIERQLFIPQRWLNTTSEDDAIKTNVADLIGFGHALGEGALLTAPLQDERLRFADGYGLGVQSYAGMLGHFGEGCAVFHEPLSDVTIALLFTGALDSHALVPALFEALR